MRETLSAALCHIDLTISECKQRISNRRFCRW